MTTDTDLKSLPGFRPASLWYEDVSVGDELPVLEKIATTQQLAMYAGASGDFVPIHYDLNVAKGAGHKSVIIHGALKSAWLAQMVNNWVGESGRLIEMSVQYRGIDYPDDRLTCRGKVTGRRVEDGVGLVELEIGLENGEGQVTTPGAAVVALPVKASVAGGKKK